MATRQEEKPHRPWFGSTGLVKAAVDCNKGLCYMHHDCSPPIVHRDVKSSNILLDSEFNAKIAYFGLAKILEKHKPGSEEPNNISSIAGSMGYFVPEYAYERE